MAGSFGYEKEHYEVSRLGGEARLFAADATTRVAARVRLGAGHLRMRAAFVTLADALDAVDLDCPARNVYVTEAALCAAA